MSVISTLQKLLHCTHFPDANGDYLLKELDQGAKLKSLRLTHLKSNMVIIAVDAGRNLSDQRGNLITKRMSSLFSDQPNCNHNKACDFVLVHEFTEGKCDLYYIDLKSDDPTGYEWQFKSTCCFLFYLRKILEDIEGVRMEIKKERFILFHTDKSGGRKSLSKMPTTRDSTLSKQPRTPYKRIVEPENTRVPCTELFAR